MDVSLSLSWKDGDAVITSPSPAEHSLVHGNSQRAVPQTLFTIDDPISV